MHLYVLAKGIKPDLERWQNDLLAKYLPVWDNGKLKCEPDGKQHLLQLAIRPVQIFEVGFHKQNLDTVMNMIGTSDYILNRYPLLKMGAKGFRKLMNLKPVPMPKNPIGMMQPFNPGKAVAVVPIGLKEDTIDAAGKEQL